MYIEDELESSNFYEQVWGHRFKIGQSSYELMLEFLNVIYGANYKLGASYYKKAKKINFRKLMHMQQNKDLYDKINLDDSNKVFEFLKGFTIYSQKRPNWGAHFLYPINESALYVEVRDKGKKGLPSDIGIERNIFTRGGELYYLMISGADNNEYKVNIEDRLKYYLQKNSNINCLINTVDNKINKDEKENSYGILNRNINSEDIEEEVKRYASSIKSFPVLSWKNVEYFNGMAKQLTTLLKNNINQLDMLENLRILISIQVSLYIYKIAYTVKENENSSPIIFIDCTCNGDEAEVKKLAVKSLKDNENIMREKLEKFFANKIRDILKVVYDNHKDNINYLIEDDLRKYLGLDSLKGKEKGNKAKIKNIIEGISFEVNASGGYEELLTVVEDKYYNDMLLVYMDQFNKNFRSLPKDMLKEVGLASYKVGENYRYVIDENIINVLVLSIVEPGQKIEFLEFMNMVYQNYGIVIGYTEAEKSSIYEKSALNAQYFNKNLECFREKLRNTGYLREYSDATAMVENKNV